MNVSLEGGKGGVVLVEGGCYLGLVLDEDVVLLKVLGVCQLDGGGSRLGLGGLHALLEVVEGHPQHLPLGVGGKGAPKGGESAHVHRRGGERGSERRTGALVWSAVEAWMSGRPEEEWCRGRSRRRIGPSRGYGRVGLRRRSCDGVLAVKWHLVRSLPGVGSQRRGRRGEFARCVQVWDGFGRATVIFGHISKFEHLCLGGKLKCTVIRGPYCGYFYFRAVIRGQEDSSSAVRRLFRLI